MTTLTQFKVNHVSASLATNAMALLRLLALLVNGVLTSFLALKFQPALVSASTVLKTTTALP